MPAPTGRDRPMTDRRLGTLVQHLHRLVHPATAEEPSDRELLERFARGREEAALAGLVHRHGPLELGVCRRVLRHAQDAEDAFQATFLVLARKAGSVSWKESVAHWLYEVAYRLAAKVRAEGARRRVKERRAGVMAQRDARSEAEGREFSAVLDEELHRLPAAYQGPLVCCYLEGLTRDQAARRLRCSLRTLDRRLERGRRLLRDRLARRGVTL